MSTTFSEFPIEGKLIGERAELEEVTGDELVPVQYAGITYFVRVSNLGVSGDPGAPGAAGQKGWSPVLALIDVSGFKAMKVSDWVGGQGAKPAYGLYVGSAGLVADIADAVLFGSGRKAILAEDTDPIEIDWQNDIAFAGVTYAAAFGNYPQVFAEYDTGSDVWEPTDGFTRKFTRDGETLPTLTITAGAAGIRIIIA